jgi:hypothetical protein
MEPNFEDEKKRFSWSSLAEAVTGLYEDIRGGG